MVILYLHQWGKGFPACFGLKTLKPGAPKHLKDKFTSISSPPLSVDCVDPLHLSAQAVHPRSDRMVQSRHHFGWNQVQNQCLPCKREWLETDSDLDSLRVFPVFLINDSAH